MNAIKARYPNLEVKDFFGVYAFFVPGERQSVIDVTYPHRADLQETLAHPEWVEDRGHRFRVPTLEAALANKYGAMLAPNRAVEKRQQDIVDFRLMVRHSLDEGRRAIDLTRLEMLGNLVWPEGAGQEILRLVDIVKKGGLFGLHDLVRT